MKCPFLINFQNFRHFGGRGGRIIETWDSIFDVSLIKRINLSHYMLVNVFSFILCEILKCAHKMMTACLSIPILE